MACSSLQNWIIIKGQPIDTTHGGGFEFFGPYTEAEAKLIRSKLLDRKEEPGQTIVLAVQLINFRSVV